jgi:YVTN family beta-propeller protein
MHKNDEPVRTGAPDLLPRPGQQALARERAAAGAAREGGSRTLPGLARAALAAFLVTGCSLQPGGSSTGATRDPVGRHGPRLTRYYQTPVNQVLTPAGLQVELPRLRPQALALSPDGKLLVVSGRTPELVLVEPSTGKILQRVPLPSEEDNDLVEEAVSTHLLKPDKSGQVSFTGLVFSPDGLRLYLANVQGSIKVFKVDAAHQIAGLGAIRLPHVKARGRTNEIPAGLAVSRDGRRLYAVLNLSNRLAELDAATGRVLGIWDVGVAPYDVVLAGAKAYVSNWGGPRPDTNSVTGPAGRGTRVRVDPVRHIACEGSVTVIDLASSNVVGEIKVGLHSSALALSPNGRHLVVANAASDTLSVIDTQTDQVVETIWTRSSPADLFGASPNALVFDRSGQTLYVCNGTQNAVAVISFRPGQSRLEGLIPVGWFPGAITLAPRQQTLCVANLKGLGETREHTPTNVVRFNSREHHGSVSLVPVPSDRELAEHTRVAWRNMRQPLLEAARLPARPDAPARPVPERVGEPSLFKHVVYIIKENRTYDQVLGDMPEGRGDPALCIYGERITPNHHRLAREFVLLDNTYCSGILSADGHQWTGSAFATDYMEKSFAGFPRSYPDGMDDDDVDALAYSPAGFIWDNAIAHGRTLRDYGEFSIIRKGWKDPRRKGKITWLHHYSDYVQDTDAVWLHSDPAIESLRPYLVTNTVGWDMDVPDMFRADQFILEWERFAAEGRAPNLSLICLPNDHTSGTKAGCPTPAAYLADNDLALGRIVEAISRSQAWKETCIFVIEDDPQDGWDHVSGFRTVAYVISPYTRRGAVVSTQYNQTSVLRTMELILGLPPMNQLDATATPMFDCFTDQPNFAPYRASPNKVPLDQLNPLPKKIADPLLRKLALASARLPLDKVDQCPEDLLNRILWHDMKGSQTPYPAWATRSGDRD